MTAPEIASTPAELDAAVESSHAAPVFLFKHSLICPISDSAHRRFEAFAHAHADAARYLVIEIQNARATSNALAERTGIRHESPQVLLLREGTVVWHASHGAITEAALTGALTRD